MPDFISKVANRLKLDGGQERKLRSTASLLTITSEKQVEAVLAGIREGETNTAVANQALQKPVEYPRSVDSCPICHAHMSPVTLAGRRPAFFCAAHNVCMPATE